MRRNILNKLLIVCGLIVIVGCKAKKQAIVNKKPADTAAKPVVLSKLNAIKAGQLNFASFSGRAKTELDINGSSNNVTLNVRIAKGEKIWMSVTAIAGLEVARILITPDSLLVVNKLQGVYLQKPFSFIYNYVSRRLDYHSVEALLVGNAIPQLLNDNAQLKADSGRVNVSGTLDDLVYAVVVSPDMRVKETRLDNPGGGQSMQVNNTAFIASGDRLIPSQIDINSTTGSKKIKISMHYTKVEFDKPLEYKFSIPEGYVPAN